MPRLLGAEQVAGAADLEVAHRDLEARAELRVVGEGRQPRPRLGRELGGFGIEEVRVREDVRAPDAAADLVELGEAEQVGALDDERVRLRDVDPGLDDRRRDEDVGVPREEGVHALLELALGHLAVGDEEAEARAQLLQLRGRLLDRLHAVVEVEGLAVARVLRSRAVLTSSSSYSPTFVRIGRRPSGGVSMMEMSRRPESDMCSVRGIGVAERASTCTSSRSARRSSFWATPKRCSSSSTTRPEVLRDHVPREDAVRPDQHLDLALAELVEDPLLVGLRPEARDHLHAHREVAVALAERVPVLLGEDRRRAQDEGLLPVQRRRERGPHGDLRLAEADVAADEPVHRPRRLEVLLDRLDRLALVVGLAVRERRLQPLEPFPREVEREPGCLLALGVEREELARELAHRGARTALQVLPALPPSFDSAGAFASAPT